MTKTTYERIEEVLRCAKKPLAPHEFRYVTGGCDLDLDDVMDGQEYVGCSESALARRLRELRQMGRVRATRREGKAFVEYSIKEPYDGN